MRSTVMRRAADYLDLTKPNMAASDYTAAVRTCAVRTCGALNLPIHTSFLQAQAEILLLCAKK